MQARWSISAILAVLAFSGITFGNCEFNWKPTSGMNDWVGALTVYKGELIAGGSFTTAGGVEVNNIARWDGINWQPMGSGVNSSVYTLTVYDGNLIAGGWFTTARGTSTERIALWDGNSWQPLGSGMEGISYAYVDALTVYKGELIAGGNFTTAGGVSANCIARWNGSAWQPLGEGTSGGVTALTVYEEELIAGGWFTSAGGVEAEYIARWDGSSWQAVEGNLGLDEYHYIAALAVYYDKLIAGVEVMTAKADYGQYVDINYITRWDGSNWQPLGNGTDGSVYSLTVYNGELIAGGHFTKAGGIDVNRIARWDGSGWQPMGSGMEGSYGYVESLAVYNGELFAGGWFTTAGGVSSEYWARWGVIPVYAGDLNHDCAVDLFDVDLFVGRWLDEDCLETSWCYEADLNYDLKVDFEDFAKLSDNWHAGP